MQKYNSKYIKKQTHIVDCILVIAILSGFILKLLLIFRLKIGWDEFHFLSRVHSYQKGILDQLFQTFHVHLLGWLPWISGNEVYQIIAGRYFLFLLFVASGILIYLIARHFVYTTGALFSVFCWISFSNVIHHGCSLRYDSLCFFFFLLACFALLRETRMRLWSVVAGIAMGISLLISLKAAIHMVTLFVLLGVLLVISADKKAVYQKAAFFIILTILTFGVGLSIHQNTLPTRSLLAQQSFLNQASAKAINLDRFFPAIWFFAESLKHNLIIWWLLAVGIFHTILECKRNNEKKGLIALTFLIPLFSLLFYRNAFPYYYVFIMAPAILFCGILPERILREFPKTGSKFSLITLTIIFLLVAGGAGFHFFYSFGRDNSSQAELISVIHKMFPEPVPYIDGCSAVASFPKAGFFMSTWGFENYLAAGEPRFRRILQEERPQFILANTPHLDFDFPRDHIFFEINYDFLPEDRYVLEENFINYWGMIWLPGKIIHSQMPEEKQEFEILIPGPYVIESNENVMLDGKTRLPGDRIILTTGKHTVKSISTNQRIVFRWSNLNYEPKTKPPRISYFYGF